MGMKIPLFVILIIATAAIYNKKTYILLPFLFHGLSRSTISLLNFNTPPVDLYDPEDIAQDGAYIPPADEIQTVRVVIFCYAVVCGVLTWLLYSGTQLRRLMWARESRRRTTQVEVVGKSTLKELADRGAKRIKRGNVKWMDLAGNSNPCEFVAL